MNDRARRQQLIADLLASGPAPSQEAMVEALASLGVRTTQATLSRDLRDLGVVKGAEGYMLPNAFAGVAPAILPPTAGNGLAATGSLERALQGHLLRAHAGVGLVVCKTAPGHAQVVALELDRTPPEGVLGTVGGDDTIFVAVDSAERADTLAEELLTMAGLAQQADDRSGAVR